MSTNREKLLDVAQKTKVALYGQWEENHFFEDGNNFYGAGQGLLSEAMGLTSVMLLLVRFVEDTEVFAEKRNDEQTLRIIKSSLDYIYDIVWSDGYIVTPLRMPEETEGVLDRESAYIDTVTWVLSSSILVVYAIRQGILEIEEKYEKKAIEIMADSLAYLLSGQLECGAWGFSTDKESKKSLYFTYAAAAALADFLDYIFGELVYYENEENQNKDLKDFYDWQTVNEINNYYMTNPNPKYPKVDITEAVAAVKSKLQIWLLENCLPLLPKLSTCTPLTSEEMLRIGMVEQTESSKINILGGKDYINLYYTFYIIDILTTTSSDKRYLKIVQGEDAVSLEELKKTYKQIMFGSDYSYFFNKGNGKNAGEMFSTYIDQAIHSSRMNFSAAQRTGKDFWESEEASELKIKWEHESKDRQVLAEARGDVGFTEPALVPMALRANTVYCYYIVERADITVDNLFEMICDDRSAITKNIKKESKIKDLWDDKNYSLPVTERAIEALVDYYDYLEKTEVVTGEAGTIGNISSIDEAIDYKIEAYLQSEAGRYLLESMFDAKKEEKTSVVDEGAVARIVEGKIKELCVGNGETTVVAPVSMNVDKVIELLENVQRYMITQNALPERDSSEERERFAYALLQTYKILGEKSVLDSVEEYASDIAKAIDVSNKIKEQFKELLEALINNCDDPAGNIARIYLKSIL